MEQSVLLLSPFFFPEWISTGKYNSCLAEALVNSGARVSAVSSHPLFPSWKVEITKANLAGVRIFRGGGYIHYPSSVFLRRIILELWFLWHVLSTYFFRKIKTDIIVPVFPPSLFFCVLSAFVSSRVRKVGIVHDLQGVYVGQSRGVVARLVGTAIHWVERHCFNSCDRLVFLSVSMRDRAIDEYGLIPEKCVVCYPFVAINETRESKNYDLCENFSRGKVNVVYSGALGNKQKPDSLYAFMAALMQADSGIQCHIFSAGPHFERLRSSYSKNNIVCFHDLVPAEYLEELYARSDVQIIPQEFGTGDGSLPSKLPNLMAAGVPVFVVCDKGSEVGSLVESAGAGVVATTWDVSHLVTEFVAKKVLLLGEDRSTRRKRLQRYVAQHFSIDNVVHEILWR